jgi:hypothetical protein
MRYHRLGAAVVVALLCSSGPASSQGLFDFLFGGPAKPAVQLAPPQPIAPPPVLRYSIMPDQRPLRPEDDDGDPGRRGRDGDNSGTYTTLCVRLCDGYYWPVRHGSNRRDFTRDARMCQSSCGDDARLFFMPKTGSIEQAIDLAGKPYGKLPAALLYRKKLINGCACRPAPWSPAERARHETYALREAEARRRAEDAQIAAEIAAHEGIAAPIGSFRAAQIIGLIKRKPAPVLQPDVVALGPDAEEPVSGVVAAAPPRSRKSRADSRSRQIAPQPAFAPAPLQRAFYPQQVVIGPPTSPAPLFKPFGGAQTFSWPGDPVRR